MKTSERKLTICCRLDRLRSTIAVREPACFARLMVSVIYTKMQVLDRNGEVIEGLYATGDCGRGFFAHNDPEYIVGVAV